MAKKTTMQPPKIPTEDGTSTVPEWKRKLLEKKHESVEPSSDEPAWRKKLLQKKQEDPLANVPAWKRSLLLKKTHSDDREDPVDDTSTKASPTKKEDEVCTTTGMSFALEAPQNKEDTTGISNGTLVQSTRRHEEVKASLASPDKADELDGHSSDSSNDIKPSPIHGKQLKPPPKSSHWLDDSSESESSASQYGKRRFRTTKMTSQSSKSSGVRQKVNEEDDDSSGSEPQSIPIKPAQLSNAAEPTSSHLEHVSPPQSTAPTAAAAAETGVPRVTKDDNDKKSSQSSLSDKDKPMTKVLPYLNKDKESSNEQQSLSPRRQLDDSSDSSDSSKSSKKIISSNRRDYPESQPKIHGENEDSHNSESDSCVELSECESSHAEPSELRGEPNHTSEAWGKGKSHDEQDRSEQEETLGKETNGATAAPFSPRSPTGRSICKSISSDSVSSSGTPSTPRLKSFLSLRSPKKKDGDDEQSNVSAGSGSRRILVISPRKKVPRSLSGSVQGEGISANTTSPAAASPGKTSSPRRSKPRRFSSPIKKWEDRQHKGKKSPASNKSASRRAVSAVLPQTPSLDGDGSNVIPSDWEGESDASHLSDGGDDAFRPSRSSGGSILPRGFDVSQEDFSNSSRDEIDIRVVQQAMNRSSSNAIFYGESDDDVSLTNSPKEQHLASTGRSPPHNHDSGVVSLEDAIQVHDDDKNKSPKKDKKEKKEKKEKKKEKKKDLLASDHGIKTNKGEDEPQENVTEIPDNHQEKEVKKSKEKTTKDEKHSKSKKDKDKKEDKERKKDDKERKKEKKDKKKEKRDKSDV